MGLRPRDLARPPAVLHVVDPERVATLGPVNLSLHNYTTFANVLALPLTPFFGIVAAFNVIYIFNVALTGFAMYLLAREVVGRHSESWLAGALFTASPMLIARGTAHFSLVAAAPLPLFVLFLSRAIRFQRPRDAMFAGLIVAWAAFCDAYYAVYCLLLAVFMLGRAHAAGAPPGRRACRRAASSWCASSTC